MTNKNETNENVEYKIEKKPGLWMVTRETGCYSSRKQAVDVVAANSPEEAWMFLCAIWTNIFWGIADEWVKTYGSHEYITRAVWMDNKLALDENSKEDDFNWSSDYDDIWAVRIEMLPVYYVKKI
jgi:hypothetical protein